MIHFSDLMSDLSSFEKNECAIILNGYNVEIYFQLLDEENLDEYGIIDMKYDEEEDQAILYFDEKIYQDLIEEYEWNHMED
jgi:hypothetical protein